MDYEERRREIHRLRFEERWTLREIGERFGISREMVRKIVGNTGYVTRDRLKAKIKNLAGLTDDEIAERVGISKNYASILRCELGIRKRGTSKGTSLGTSSQVLEECAGFLKSLGFHCQLQKHGSPFNILVDGCARVLVKACMSPSVKRTKNPQWSFNLSAKYAACDFYILMTGNRDYFVIPSEDIPDGMGHVRFVFPTSKRGSAKWQGYHNRFDLLREFIEGRQV